MIDLKTGDGNGQNILMIVLLGLMIVILVLLIIAAYFIIPAAVKNSANKDNEDTSKEHTVSINITNGEIEQPKKQAPSDTQKQEIYRSESDESNYELDSSYILPFSNRRKLTSSDINNLNLEELMFARNEIFARHGYIFNTPWIMAYFESKSWYMPNPNYDGSLNSIEYYNVDLIKKYENILKGGGTNNSSGSDNGYILPYSDRRKLAGYEISGLSLDGLVLARNEIYARHGYVFKTPWIRQYFNSKSWYAPDPYYDGTLDDIEYYNVLLIKEYEEILKGQ